MIGRVPCDAMPDARLKLYHAVDGGLGRCRVVFCVVVHVCDYIMNLKAVWSSSVVSPRGDIVEIERIETEPIASR
jgi:hypothetical protein